MILDTDDFEYISKLLCNSKLLTKDFEEVIDMAEEGDL